jgi:hypothetical protein
MGFCGKHAYAACNGRRIEIQIRTPLQHSWATAVEAIGSYRSENLKGGQGNKGWLRFFKLMSAEFSEAEGCPFHSSMPEHGDRVREIRELNDSHKISETLDNLRHLVDWAQTSVLPHDKATHLLIKYNNFNRTVTVMSYSVPILAAKSYDMAEDVYNKTGEYLENIVLVEVEKLGDIRKAFPNYFLDVQPMREQLGRILQGKRPEEFKVLHQERVRQPPRATPISAGWARRNRFPKPKGA